MLDSALDADPEELHPDARKFVEDIRRFGWYVTHVYASETEPSFTYTTGLCATKTLPEFIVFGLDMKLAHGILRDLIDQLERGVEMPSGLPIANVLHGV